MVYIMINSYSRLYFGLLYLHDKFTATLMLGSDALQVIRHSLTLRLRNQVTVEQPNECTDEISHLQCDGELSGRYTWARENDNTNYVLFILNGRAVISRINLTYIVESSSEKPKVSFCAISDNATVNSNLTAAGLDCQEVPIEPTEGAARNEILPMPFNNDTSRIVMEVITQGIKTAFEATEVQFCGTFVKIGKSVHPQVITMYRCTYSLEFHK